VLTAAHCSQSFGEVQLGRHNLSNNSSEVYESLVAKEIVTHPSYFRNRHLDVDPHDVAVVKLFGRSSFEPIRINRDALIPESRNDSMHVIGWGSTNPDEVDERSEVLRETVVFYIPNDECQQVVGSFNGYEKSFNGAIIDVTLCAMNFEELSDSCKGDSGGPLLMHGYNSSQEDFLVGITSAGYGCANPTLPALYARVSEVHGWIDKIVCELSAEPPEDFGCPSPVEKSLDLEGGCDTSASQNVIVEGCTPEEASTTLVLEFQLDRNPEERGWILHSRKQRGVFFASQERPILSYADQEPFSSVSEKFQVPDNDYYVLTLLDSSGDGNLPIDNQYSVSLKREGGEVLLLLPAVGTFRYSSSFGVTVGILPTNSPTQTSSPSVSFMPTSSPTTERVYLTIVINFDSYPENAGFRLEVLADQVYRSVQIVYPGTYAKSLAGNRIREIVHLLPPGSQLEKYRFTMTANEGFGFLTGGSYQVWMGPDVAGNLLFEGGDFYLEDANTFEVEPFFSLPPFAPISQLTSPPTLPPDEMPTFEASGDSTPSGIFRFSTITTMLMNTVLSVILF
jgi:hypothetical protein